MNARFRAKARIEGWARSGLGLSTPTEATAAVG